MYYPDRERGTSSVGGRHEITSDWVPKAIVQCAPPPGQVAGEATLRMWEQVEAAQVHPTWRRSIPTIEDGVVRLEWEQPVDLATQVCFPRCIEFQTAFRREAGAAPNMSAWVAAPQLAIEPQPGSGTSYSLLSTPFETKDVFLNSKQLVMDSESFGRRSRDVRTSIKT